MSEGAFVYMCVVFLFVAVITIAALGQRNTKMIQDLQLRVQLLEASASYE